MPPSITDLRERTSFLEKTTRYVFSLNIWLTFDCPRPNAGWDGRLRARGARPEEIDRVQGPLASGKHRDQTADSFHVIDEELTTTVDGGVHEMPLLQVNDLQDWITVERGGILDLAGRCRLRSDDDARISMSYSGVVRLGFSGERMLCASDGEPSGSAQIAAQFESDRPRYRWLTQAQFIGFGAASVRIPTRPGEPYAWVKTLGLSLDFYSAI